MKIGNRKYHPILIFSRIFTISLLILECFILHHLSKTEGIIDLGLKFDINYERIFAEQEPEPTVFERGVSEETLEELTEFVGYMLSGTWENAKESLKNHWDNKFVNEEKARRFSLNAKWEKVIERWTHRSRDTQAINDQHKASCARWNEGFEKKSEEFASLLYKYDLLLEKNSWDDFRFQAKVDFSELFRDLIIWFNVSYDGENSFLDDLA